MSESRFRISARLAAYYGALFFVIGVLVPFWPIWLQSRGLTPEHIGIVLAVGPWLRILVDPVVTRAADRSGSVRRLILIAAAVSLLAFVGFAFAGSFWPILLITVVFAPTFHVLIPLGDAQTMAAVRRHGLDYGRIRLWGSITFVVAALGAGKFLTGRDPNLIWWTVFASLLAVFLAALLLRDEGAAPRHSRWRDILAFVRARRFLVFALAASLVQASHAVLNGFSGIHWKAAGYSELAVGLLWAGGVVAEIALFAVSGKVFAWIGARRLLLLGAGAACVRWIILAGTVDLPGLVVAQALHGVSFGATWLATMHYISSNAPDGMKASAQGAYASLSGIVMGVTLIAAGDLYGSYAGAAFYAMAGVSVVALLLALAVGRARD
jgi:PPP family 3-phenylpropionic acid transporter